MDERIRGLERRAAGGDEDAQRSLDAARVRICAHVETQNYIQVGSMLSDSETVTYCKKCGACVSHPERAPRPAALRAEQEFLKRLNALPGGTIVTMDLLEDCLGCPVDPE